MAHHTARVHAASSTFLTWSLLPTFIGYLLSLAPADVPMPPVGEGCLAVAPTEELIATFNVEMVNDFNVTAICCNTYSFTGSATGSNPTLTLTRGVTYTFGLTGGGSHPFAIRATAGGANIAGPFTAATFTFTPDFVMPANMVYQCAIHSPMLGNIVLVNPNSPPNATNLSVAEAYTEDVALNLTDIVVTDADNALTTATLTLSTPAAGSLSTASSGPVTSTYNPGTGVWTASGMIANVNTLLAGLTFVPAANFSTNFTIATSVSDGIAAAVTGNKAMTGTPVNDAPTLGNGTLAAVGEDSGSPSGQSVTIIFTGQFTDPDAGASFAGIAVLGNTANAGTQGAWQYSSNGGTNWFNIGTVSAPSALVLSTSTMVRFVPVFNFSGVPAALSARGLDNTYGGSSSSTAGSEARVTISTASSGGTTAISSAVASLSTTITAVNDAPQATNLSALETYTEDMPLNLVDIVASDVDNASVTATLTLSNTAAGSLNTGTSGPVTSIYITGTGVWTASGPIANVNTLLAGLTFTPAANFNSAFTIATSVSDGVAAPATGSKAISGIAVNDAPQVTDLSTAEGYTEDTGLDLVDIVASDVDHASVTATLTLSNTAAGSLNTGTSGPVTSIYITGTGVWSASGPIANVNTLLAGLIFTPSANFNSSFTIATSVSDGVAAPAAGNKPVTGTAVNDAPQATDLSASETYVQDMPLDLVDIVMGDVDNTTLTATLTLSNTAAGALSTATSGATTSTYSSGTGVWQASGAIADLNTLLAGVNYLPTAGFSGAFSILTSVSDGLAAPLTGSKTMTGTATNIAVAVRVHLEGAYSATTGLMSDALRGAGVLPTAEPFSSLGYTHVGGGGESTIAGVFAITGSNAIVDWVVIELRDMTTPATILATLSALVQRDGDVVGMDGTSSVAFTMPPGSYHVAARHRNHLGCMTGAAITLSATAASIDFTSPATSIFGTGAVKSVSGAFPAQVLWAGDVTFNGLVKYTGSGNDRDPVLVTVGSAAPNNVLINAYSTRDVNMNTEVKYTGSANDRDPILVNVGSTTPNNVRTQQLP